MSLALNRESIAALQGTLQNVVGPNTILSSLRDRLETIDKYIARESAGHGNLALGQAVNRMGDKSKIADLEIPLCLIQQETALAYYTSIFASGFPMFGVVGERASQAAVQTQMATLIGRDQMRFNWTSEVIQILRDAIKYNICGAEVAWTSKRAINVTTRNETGKTQTGRHSAVVYSGNRIRRLDMYNTFWDATCPVSKVHEFGQFAGYIERFNYIRLKQFMLGLNDVYLVKQNLTPAFRSGGATGAYKVPSIRRDSDLPADASDWSKFFGFASPNKSDGISGKYEVVTAYMRLIPKEFKLQVPAAGHPQVFQLIWVNGLLIYAEPIISGHEYLPIVLAQATDEGLGLETKSQTENLMPLQDFGSSVINGTIASMRRAVADRALYNPKRVKPEDVNSPNPQAKIPVSFTAYDENFENAYKEIPYHDTVTGMFTQNLNFAMQLSDQVAGTNRAAQGNFVKGNRTYGEFDTVMTNQNARQQLGAINLHSTLFVPIQQIIKTNYLMHAIKENVFNPAEKRVVDIDPVALREQAVEFQLSDGILPSAKLGNMEIINTAIGALGQIPEAGREFKVMDMMVHLLKLGGFNNLDDFRRTPEERKAYEDYQLQLAAAANPKPQ